MLMIKFIEFPDFHFSNQWLDSSKLSAESVRRSAIDNNVDFIAIPGDFWDRPVLSSDTGGINAARAIIKMLSKVCPVVAIEGTPSHDAPGSYGPLEDCGLQLLKPGKAYTNIPGVVLFGIPELNKDGIQASLGIAAEQANLEAEKMLEQYVLDFIAPHRALYQNAVAVGLIHGNVTDSRRENTQDIILKASDILIRTEILEPANLDRWSAGHLHTPFESKIISAGYSGFTGNDSNPFGKTGFKPAMNLVTIDGPGSTPVITRVPYGTPERRKITKPLDVYDPEIAYWLDTEDQSAECPTGHFWSRVTHRPIERKAQLVEVKKDMSLPEIFKVWDKNVTDSVIEKVKTIGENVMPQAMEPLDISVESVEIDGCIFWKGGHIKFDISGSKSGVSRMSGRMGDGKSSLLGFCTPYPVITGKDTESGRPSAIKEFFNGENSSIKKTILRNGVRHEHLITIKAAHTKSAKTECFLFVDGLNLLDTTSFDEMMEKCELLYGPYYDYLLTTFYIQPLQSSQGPGLMAAKKVDARNVVQGIAGVNRESEARYALDQKSYTSKAMDDKAAWIAGAEQFIESSESVHLAIDTMSEIGRDACAKMQLLAETGKTAKQEVDKLQALANESALESARKNTDLQRIYQLNSIKPGLMVAQNMLESNKAVLVDILEAKQVEQKNTDLKNAYDKEAMEWNWRLMDAKQIVELANKAERDKYQQAMQEYNAEYVKFGQMEGWYKAQIQALELVTVTPCEACGHIEGTAAEKYSTAQAKIAEYQGKLATGERPTEPIEPKYQTEPTTLPDAPPTPPAYIREETPPFSEASIRAKISEGEIAGSKISEIDKELATLAAMTYQIDETIAARLQEANAKTESLRTQYADERSRKEKAEHEVTALIAKLESIASQTAKITEARLDLETIEANLVDWSYIAKSLQPANIPALELEMSIQAIDFEATRILKPFMEGQYTIRTEAADGFDILIYDGETGTDTSFFKKNPGHKAFFADAYTKALIRQRNERHHRSYSPIIMDEADAPIEVESIQGYYQMQDAYFDKSDARVLVVSHKGTGHITNTIDVKGLQQ
jgi:translation initiation factor 2 beta subunit (eIF-2beta)/eIF-5